MKAPVLPTAGSARRAVIIRGAAWNSGFQVFVAAISFGSMLVLVRVVSPGEYGRAAAATGVLALINCFNCSGCIAQAVQLREGETPDWAAHWQAGFFIQMALGLVCNLVAAAAWLVPAYRPIAPLLHLASIGLLVDWPNQLGLTMLRRDMNFRRMRLVQGVGVLLTAGSSVAVGMMGGGAYALILGANVLSGLPFGLDLLFLRGWRPGANWWCWPDWRAYRSSLRFGAQISGTALLNAARGLFESLILPGAVGYEAMGLLNRAQVLFTATIGRVNTMVIETVYPLLPRSAGDPALYARHATLFVQVMLLMVIPGAVFVGLEGPSLSRLLYGRKWIAADPLIWPGTIVAACVAALAVFGAVLLGANRLRLSFATSLLAALVTVPAIPVALSAGGVRAYAWSLAVAEIVAASLGMVLTLGCLESNSAGRTLVPPLVAAILAGLCLWGLSSVDHWVVLAARIGLHAAVYGLAFVLVMRTIYPATLHSVLGRLPGGDWCARLLGFPAGVR